MAARLKLLIFFSIIFLGFFSNNNLVLGFSCSTPDYCPATVIRRSWSCANTWHECGTGSFGCSTDVTCSDDCCAGSPPPATTIVPTSTPAPSCPVNTSCCYLPLTVCAANSQCPTGYRWCYAGICVKENYNPNTNTCVPPTPRPTASPTPLSTATPVPSLPPTVPCQITNVSASDNAYANRIYISWIVQNGNEAQRIDIYQGNIYLTSKSNTDSGQWNFNHQNLTCPVTNTYHIYCWKDDNLYGRGSDTGSILCPTPTPTLPAGGPTPTLRLPTPTPTLPVSEPTITPRPTVPPLAYEAWFQSQDGDVHAQENISDPLSPFPAKIFALDGEGGFPGVVSFRGSNARFGSGMVSSKEWLVKTRFVLRNFHFYDAFLGSPRDHNFDGGMPGADGIYFAGSDQVIAGDWELSGGKKIIILADGNVRILGNIIVPYGSSLVLVASGNINFGNGVSRAQGIFLADKKMATGKGPVAFEGEGSFVAGQEIILGRDFGDSQNRFTPAEKFLFRPDLLINSLTDIWSFGHVWEELAP